MFVVSSMFRVGTHTRKQTKQDEKKNPIHTQETKKESFRPNLQESRLMLLTKLMCTPSRRCDPEHSKQQKAPTAVEPGGELGGGTISDAHRGCLSGQSEQT